MAVAWDKWESWSPDGTGSAAQQVRELIRLVMALHSTFRREIWLWRGQSRVDYSLEPGMHMRVRNAGLPMEEEYAVAGATALIAMARENRLDEVEGLRLPDLALLAHLQHHGAATPLLDVTVDPFVALWMVAHASGPDPMGDDEVDGALFGILRPSRTLASLDSRPYQAAAASSIAGAIAKTIHWYRPPEISERLRIQRGSFIVGPLIGDDQVTIPLRWEADANARWLQRRFVSLGNPGRPVNAETDVVAFRVTARMKPTVREWLEDRAGLSQAVIYPTPWHRPFLEEFCRSYGRARGLDQP